MKTLRQIFAIARVEFRFGLRRGAPVVVTAAIGLLVGAGFLISPIINLSNVITPPDDYTPQQWQRLAQIGITPAIVRFLDRDVLADMTAGGASQSWFPVYLGLLFLPLATAGVIPADRKFGTLELLRSLPIDGKRYLAGKLLGTLAIVALVACFPLLLFLALLEGILLSHTGFGIPLALIGFFLKLSVLDSLPVMLFGATLGVTVGIAARSRRAAILPGFAAVDLADGLSASTGIIRSIGPGSLLRSRGVPEYLAGLLDPFHRRQFAGAGGSQPAGRPGAAGRTGPGDRHACRCRLDSGRSCRPCPPLPTMEGEFLMIPLRQILAIARAELRFAFRRGAPVAVTVLTGLLVSTGILLLMADNLPVYASALTFTPDQQARWLAAGFSLEQHARFVANGPADMLVMGTLLGGLLMFTALLLLPAATISAVPADRVFGVAELMRSTPLTGARYLAGKVLGVLAAVALTGMVMLGLFFAAANILFFSTMHFGLSWNASRYYLEIAFLDGSLFLLWGTGVGVLLGALFRTRRAAIFPGLFAGGLSLVFWLEAFRPPSSDPSMLFTDRLQYYLLQNYHSIIAELAQTGGFDAGPFGWTQRVAFSQVVLMFLTVLGALAILAVVARLWLKWKENF